MPTYSVGEFSRAPHEFPYFFLPILPPSEIRRPERARHPGRRSEKALARGARAFAATMSSVTLRTYRRYVTPRRMTYVNITG